MAELFEVTGMVIVSTPMNEYDKRVVLLTKELGKISAFARGARKQGNQLMAACDSFAFGTFTLYPGRNAYSIEKAQINNYFRELAEDIDSVYYGYYFLELADYFAHENEDGSDMLKLLYYALRMLSDERMPNEIIRAAYELKMLVLNGQYPDFFSCKNCGSTENIAGFSIMLNGALCGECLNQKGALTLSATAVYALQYIVTTPADKLFSFTVIPEALCEIKKVMRLCMNAYVDKKMKSLDILENLL